jgi:hypothetical protein
MASGCINTWTRQALALVAVSVIGACASVAPMQEVRPEPAFIEAAVEPDNEVEIGTTDGRELSFVVAKVESGKVFGTGGEEVAFADIDSISIRSWSEPTHPCGAGEPVGCSIPEVITAVSSYHEVYKDYFHSACVEHDYCYRHGLATYGLNQGYCDNRFYSDMMELCGSAGGGILGITDLDGLAEKAKCRLAADQFYAAVHAHGYKAFRTTNSTYCEFDGTDGPR